MKEYAPYLAHQIARFGALTISQMQYLCRGRCSRASLYRTLGQLMKAGHVIRLCHETKPLVVYPATRKLYELVYGEQHERHTGVRTTEMEHTIACAQTMIDLSRYSGITGIATEHEWTPDEIRLFCRDRIPDALIQITHADLSYEIAVEVETSLKSQSRVAEVISHYQQTLLRNMPCVGALIVAGGEAILAKYQKAMEVLPSEVEERILLTTPEGLRTLNPRYYGTMTDGPGPALERRRTSSQGRGNYICMKSAGYGVPTRFLGAEEQRGSGFLSEV